MNLPPIVAETSLTEVPMLVLWVSRFADNKEANKEALQECSSTMVGPKPVFGVRPSITTPTLKDEVAYVNVQVLFPKAYFGTVRWAFHSLLLLGEFNVIYIRRSLEALGLILIRGS